jgi:hypothetical protein
MDGTTGAMNWIRQIGTASNERLAKGQGLEVDGDGNAIVFGETTGSLYADNQGSNDMLVFTMNRNDGSYLTPSTEGEGVGVDNPEEIPSNPTAPGVGVLPYAVSAEQTGPDVGPTYAGGMVYDPFTNAIYVTGATYGSFSEPGVSAAPTSKCFLGIAQLPSLTWQERSLFGTDGPAEACSALSVTEFLGKSEVILVGSTEAGGLLTGLSTNSGGVQQYGMILDLFNQDGKYQLLGGAVIDDDPVQFPIQVLTNGDRVYVVSMASSDTQVTADFEQKSSEETPNFTTGGIEKYGSEYTILVESHTITHNGEGTEAAGVIEITMSLDWRRPFETADKKSIYVSGMTTIDNGETLIIVGSTRGSQQGDDFDGIMAKINSQDGSFQSDSARTVAYFSSVSGNDDWIYNVCHDPDDSSSFYVVGATEGSIDASVDNAANGMSTDAVIAKISTDGLAILWSTQIEVARITSWNHSPTAMALGCDVIPGKGMMYIAGNVKSGSVIVSSSDPQQSIGGDDIFVGKVSTSDGSLVWLKQVGSSGDDRVARGGGVAADANGNAIVYGDTNGAFYRRKSVDEDPGSSDLFLMVFDEETGLHIPPVELTEWHSDPTSSFYSNPKYLAFAIAVCVLLVVAVFFFVVGRRRQRKRSDNQKSNIFAYLQQFDVEDIDLRKSPPGGWHGTYLNKLAYGINKADKTTQFMPESLKELEHAGEDPNTEMASLTHSSIIKDSLFMDTMSTPSLGGNDYGYDDLKARTSFT